MTTRTLTPAPAATQASALSAGRTGAVAAGVALLVNVAAFLGSIAAGLDLVLRAPGGPEFPILLPSVVLMTVAPIAVGTAALAAAAKARPHAVRQLAWIGLVIGIGTALMPLSMQGDVAVKTILAVMHVATGAAWFAAVSRHAR